MVRTTVRLPERLMDEAKDFARRNDLSLTEVIAEGVRLRIQNSIHGRVREQGLAPLPVSKATGGLRSGVDLQDTKALWDLLDVEMPNVAF